MAGTYTIYLSRPEGTRLRLIDSVAWHTLRYRRPVNAPGALTLTLSGSFDVALIALDSRIEVWRCEGSGPMALDTETVWLARSITKRIDTSGRRTIEVGALSALELLDRRIVAYNDDTSQSSKTMAADSMIREIVLENLGSSATDTTRSLASYLTIAAAAGTGASITKNFARRNVLKTCQEIARASYDAGTPVYFDIVAPTQNTLEFRTYVTVRGTDHSYPSGINPVRLSVSTGTLTGVTRSYDYSNEATFVYTENLSTTVSSTTRMASSIFNRREVLADASNAKTAAALTSEARQALQAGRPRRIFRGEIVNAPGAVYGVHWGLGDKVSAELDGEVITCRIDMVEVTIEDGKETIKADLRAEE